MGDEWYGRWSGNRRSAALCGPYSVRVLFSDYPYHPGGGRILRIPYPVGWSGEPLRRLGGEIDFRVKVAEELFRGEIYAIEPRVALTTRSLELRARSPNSDRLLTPGAFADVELVVREVDDALTVSSIAVIPELGGKRVFVYTDGKAEPRPVETGIRTDHSDPGDPGVDHRLVSPSRQDAGAPSE